MSITKKIRFEVFKRDGFICQYCGGTPPESVLEVDHIQPKSKGGSDDMNNLVTSCFSCNRGKSNIELNKVPNKIGLNYDIIKEKEDQYRAYVRLLKIIEKRLVCEIEEVVETFELYFQEYTVTEKFKVSIRRFIKKLGGIEVIDAMRTACYHVDDYDQALKYFCGICWNKIRENGL